GRLRGLSDVVDACRRCKCAAKHRPAMANVTYQVRYSAVANMLCRRPPTIGLRAWPEFQHQLSNPIYSPLFSSAASLFANAVPDGGPRVSPLAGSANTPCSRHTPGEMPTS